MSDTLARLRGVKMKRAASPYCTRRLHVANDRHGGAAKGGVASAPDFASGPLPDFEVQRHGL
jgi:hypothetical protein